MTYNVKNPNVELALTAGEIAHRTEMAETGAPQIAHVIGSSLVRASTERAKPASQKDVLRYDVLGELKAKGACRGLPTDIFYSVDPGSPEYLTAISTCDSCVLREECLEFALETNEDFGIWGGLNANERRGIRYARIRAERLARLALTE